MRPPAVTVLYDADCGLCRVSVALLLRWDRRGHIWPVAIQSADGQRLLGALEPERRLATAHAVTTDGRLYSGGEAAVPIAAQLPGGGVLAALARRVPRLVRGAYDLVAGHRSAIGRLIPPVVRDRATAAITRRRRHIGGA